MSPQLIELLIFAGIAFFVINKLISVLGTTSEDDPAKSKSFFGENNGKIKDVTATATIENVIRPEAFTRKENASTPPLDASLVAESAVGIEEGLQKLCERMPSFNMARFLQSAKSVFEIVMNSVSDKSIDLAELADKRYLEQLNELLPSYGNIVNISALDAKISEIYMFGNNAFVKVIFTGNNVVESLGAVKEEWTFTRSANNPDKAWYLSNIDRSN